MTAEKIIIAHQLKAYVDAFVKRFNTKKRRRDRVEDWKQDYAEVLGSRLMGSFPDDIDQVMPQCSVFLCGTIFKDYRDFQGWDPAGLPSRLDESGEAIIREHLFYILTYARKNKSRAEKSWPVLLKSNTFFTRVADYIQGIRERNHPSP